MIARMCFTSDCNLRPDVFSKKNLGGMVLYADTSLAQLTISARANSQLRQTNVDTCTNAPTDTDACMYVHADAHIIITC